jgi:hypothetical protein
MPALLCMQSFCVFRRWEACRCLDDGEEARPWFRVHQTWKHGCGAAAAADVVTMHGGGRTYEIEGSSRKSDYRIRGADGAIMAAVGRKRTASGVVLGDDVLTLTVGSGTDHLLALSLVVVCGIMNRRL